MNSSSYNNFYNSDENVIFHYQGIITHKIIETMADNLIKKLKADNADNATLSAIYGVFIELAQNIQRYSAEKYISDGNKLSYGMIKITKSDSYYIAEACNKVDYKSKTKLSKYIDDIKKLDYQNLKARFKNRLIEDPDSFSISGGIGILEMALKSHNRISYQFKNADSDLYYFSIKLKLGG